MEFINISGFLLVGNVFLFLIFLSNSFDNCFFISLFCFVFNFNKYKIKTKKNKIQMFLLKF